ncbi:flagellar hook-length control protein FliK [Marinomonas sp. A79]|uniref:Flagellar hook-length control protein FliK n=1 Tax=Marinomonas vulgaris TaxID=2823372 RepID=A0ABS5HB33_9GAMM|nr:flagellar hook-length control protein FliK [Marinomonas vulgaris]MBR7888667.1 flagellar hook-length control protein FliK [Marinomonas vulgaris]
MLSDISSKLNQTSTHKNTQSSSSPATSQAGVLGKLSSEIQLIDSLKMIKLQGSEPLSFQGKPAQLLHATSAGRPISLINTGSPIDVHNAKPAQLNNLTLASRVVNLTVTSVADNSSASVNSPKAVTVTDGQSSFTVISQQALKKGDQLRVFVDANQKMQALPAQANSALSSTQLDALKQSLPKQLSISEMNQLIKQLQALNANADNLPPKTQAALKQLVQHLPNLAALTQSPDAMKQAIQNSGVFSESLLLNQKDQSIPADLKLNLARLKETQEQPTGLKPQSLPTDSIANAIERITTNQLRHFSDPSQLSAQAFPLQVEFPVQQGKDSHLVQVEIDQDASSEEQDPKDRRWLVKLKFDFEETGRFDARASIQNNTVGVLFAAEEKDTVQKLQKSIPELRQQLEAKDIEINRLDAFQSKLERQETPLNQTHSLIDVRT